MCSQERWPWLVEGAGFHVEQQVQQECLTSWRSARTFSLPADLILKRG